MGYMRHHAIVVTSDIEKLIAEAHEKAKEIFGDGASEVIKDNINGYISFFIAPDGSKEGWEPSQEGNQNRKAFVKWINAQAYDDGSNSLSFCEFLYGDTNGECRIENHN